MDIDGDDRACRAVGLESAAISIAVYERHSSGASFDAWRSDRESKGLSERSRYSTHVGVAWRSDNAAQMVNCRSTHSFSTSSQRKLAIAFDWFSELGIAHKFAVGPADSGRNIKSGAVRVSQSGSLKELMKEERLVSR